MTGRIVKRRGMNRKENFKEVFSKTIFQITCSWLQNDDWKISKNMIIYLRAMYCECFTGQNDYRPFARKFIQTFFAEEVCNESDVDDENENVEDYRSLDDFIDPTVEGVNDKDEFDSSEDECENDNYGSWPLKNIEESGDNDSGDEASGDNDSGDEASGDNDSGDEESGDDDSGDEESGDNDSGDEASGDEGCEDDASEVEGTVSEGIE
jgi:hypothetical protein